MLCMREWKQKLRFLRTEHISNTIFTDCVLRSPSYIKQKNHDKILWWSIFLKDVQHFLSCSKKMFDQSPNTKNVGLDFQLSARSREWRGALRVRLMTLLWQTSAPKQISIHFKSNFNTYKMIQHKKMFAKNIDTRSSVNSFKNFIYKMFFKYTRQRKTN